MNDEDKSCRSNTLCRTTMQKIAVRLQQKMKADSVLEGDSARLTLFAGDTVNIDTRDSIALMLAISAEASRNAHASVYFSLIIDGVIMRKNVKPSITRPFGP